MHRLPLRYFDRVQRGELLSRVTNDVDNIGQTMQQTLSQVVISLLTVIGVLVMMFIISPLLAMIALVTIPLTIVDHGARREAIAEDVRRAVGGHRRPERARRGDLLGSLHRQGLRAPEGGRGAVPRRERRGVPRELRRAVPVGHHHARHDVHREPRLCGDRRRRRPDGRERPDVDRRCAGLHPVLAPVHAAAQPARIDGEPPAVGRRERRARLRAARRGRRDAGRHRRRHGPRRRRATSPSRTSRSATSRTSPSSRTSRSRRSPEARSRSSDRPAPARRRS